MRFVVALLGIMFLANVAWGAPSTTISIPNSFSANTTIKSAETNANNNEISSKFNNHGHTDITQVGTITSGTWAGSAIGTQYGGTGDNMASVASGSLIYFTDTGDMTTLDKPAAFGAIPYFDLSTSTPQWLAAGASGRVLTAQGAGINPIWSKAARILQVKSTQTGTLATGTTTLPTNDDTIPQSTEGDEYMTLSFTPTASTNIVRCEVVFNGAHTGSGHIGVALFLDAGADAIACMDSRSMGADTIRNMSFVHDITERLVTASQSTLKVRAGSEDGATTSFNGQAGAQKMGGRLASSITLVEYQN